MCALIKGYGKIDFSTCLETFRDMQPLRLLKVMLLACLSFIATQIINLLKMLMVSSVASTFMVRL